MSVHVASASLAPPTELRGWPRAAVWSRLAEHRRYPKGALASGVRHDGQIELYSPHAGVVVGRIRGHFTVAMAREWIAEIDPIVRASSEPVTGFHDWELMTGYDSASRRELTEYAGKTRSFHGPSHILVGSKLVAMGVSAAALTLGLIGFRMRSYADRTTFEAALSASV